ncbi:MAG: cell division protein ZapE [Rhizobiaceae bacterium]
MSTSADPQKINLHPLAKAIGTRVSKGALQEDLQQKPVICFLDQLLDQLSAPAPGNKKSALGWLFGNAPAPISNSARGLYLWGGVGRGKSMLMDLFFDLAPVKMKKRVHFHGFMQDVHQRIHQWRQLQKSMKDKSADPIPPLAEALAKEFHLLCFDEFAVTDVADAMILARLFTGLFERGVTVVATSNVAPDLLYKEGLNRSFFLPFIEVVKNRMEVMELASDKDYRMEKLSDAEIYLAGKGAASRFQELWEEMTSGLKIAPATIEVSGRRLEFPLSCGGIVRASFAELCEKPLGAGDYLALSGRFHTLFLEAVPIMQHSDRNAVKRFIALVDTLYDKGMLLIVEAAASPNKLYVVDHGTEAFEFQRTSSRLQEMQGQPWLARERGQAR